MKNYILNIKNQVTISRESIVQFEVFFFCGFLNFYSPEDPLYQDFIESIPNDVHSFFTRFWCFWPEFFLLLSIAFLTLHKNIKLISFIRFNLTGLLIIFSYWSVIYLTVPLHTSTHFYFSNYYFFDYYIFIIKFIFFLVFILFLSIIFFRFFYNKKLRAREVEFYRIVYLLFLSFWLFSFLLISSNNLFGFYFILEGLSFIIIFSCVLNFNKAFCLLTSIRYFTLNAFASGCFLFSIIIIQILYQTADLFYLKNIFSLSKIGAYKPQWKNHLQRKFELTNPTQVEYKYDETVFNYTSWDVAFLNSWIFYSVLVFFVFFIVGCFFKLGCFPFNWWILSINLFISYETFFLFNVIFKNLFFFYFFRVITYYFSCFSFIWIPLFLFIGFSTIMIGTFGLFSQKRLKGFFTFSSMVQIGYVFIGVALTTVESFTSIFFLHLIYLLNSVIVFSILLYFSSDVRMQSMAAKSRNVFFVLSDLSLLRLISPLAAVAFTIAILSFAGLPPTFGFFAKYYYFEVIVKSGLYKLCIVLLILNAISIYPYINMLKNLWFITSVKTFSTTFLPVFSREYFMVSMFKYYTLFNFSAIVFYKVVIEFCHKLSYCGSRIIFAQGFDDPFKFRQHRHAEVRRYIDVIFFKKQKGTWFDPIEHHTHYAAGLDNSTLLSKQHQLEIYLMANKRLRCTKMENTIRFDNFSDTLCTSGSHIDYMAFTVIGIITVFLLINCFIVAYLQDRHISSQQNTVFLLSWTSFGGKEPFLLKLHRTWNENKP